MLRESYLERVTQLSEDMARRAQRSRGQRRDLPAGMVDLLDLLRVATLDAVEAISLWRLSQVIRVSVRTLCTLVVQTVDFKPESLWCTYNVWVRTSFFCASKRATLLVHWCVGTARTHQDAASAVGNLGLPLLRRIVFVGSPGSSISACEI